MLLLPLLLAPLLGLLDCLFALLLLELPLLLLALPLLLLLEPALLLLELGAEVVLFVEHVVDVVEEVLLVLPEVEGLPVLLGDEFLAGNEGVDLGLYLLLVFLVLRYYLVLALLLLGHLLLPLVPLLLDQLVQVLQLLPQLLHCGLESRLLLLLHLDQALQPLGPVLQQVQRLRILDLSLQLEDLLLDAGLFLLRERVPHNGQLEVFDPLSDFLLAAALEPARLFAERADALTDHA